jgi:hypothetical protein
MITRDALYTFVETLVASAANGTPLKDAVSFRNLRTSVNEAKKVVRVECIDGTFCFSEEDVRKELRVRFTIQCWVTPDGKDQTDIDAAVDLSFEMARTIFDAMAGNADLGGKVCDAYGDQFETGEANLGTVRRGVTYLDGMINRAS